MNRESVPISEPTIILPSGACRITETIEAWRLDWRNVPALQS
ncbi:hypothetical protein [Alistipes senegalensis]|nr:hypothetical protein [Alistipes senegalensis]